MARPLIKLAEDPYDKPLFPPKLEWFDVNRGGYRAGEILAAFELFQVIILLNCDVLAYLFPGFYKTSVRRARPITAQKMKFSIKDFFRKCNQIRRKHIY